MCFWGCICIWDYPYFSVYVTIYCVFQYNCLEIRIRKTKMSQPYIVCRTFIWKRENLFLRGRSGKEYCKIYMLAQPYHHSFMILSTIYNSFSWVTYKYYTCTPKDYQTRVNYKYHLEDSWTNFRQQHDNISSHK